ncbi:hypothetical protein KCU87_g188, partial [Aureobasidium melanogenum]
MECNHSLTVFLVFFPKLMISFNSQEWGRGQYPATPTAVGRSDLSTYPIGHHVGRDSMQHLQQDVFQHV